MDLNKWEKTRLKGMTHFIWVRGVLFWGVGTAILWSIAMHFVAPQDPVWLRPLIALAVFPPGGLYWGRWCWMAWEKKYAESGR